MPRERAMPFRGPQSERAPPDLQMLRVLRHKWLLRLLRRLGHLRRLHMLRLLRRLRVQWLLRPKRWLRQVRRLLALVGQQREQFSAAGAVAWAPAAPRFAAWAAG